MYCLAEIGRTVSSGLFALFVRARCSLVCKAYRFHRHIVLTILISLSLDLPRNCGESERARSPRFPVSRAQVGRQLQLHSRLSGEYLGVSRNGGELPATRGYVLGVADSR